MKKYLLDTNICIYFLKGKYNLNNKIDEVAEKNCFISEITVAELKFGIENSNNRTYLESIVLPFLPKFHIIPIFNCLDLYAKEKARLRRIGLMVDDFDLLIGATAVANDMVTNNTAHFSRIDNIELENWTAI